jgi:hypothetical protein
MAGTIRNRDIDNILTTKSTKIMKRDKIKIVIALIAGAYFLWGAANPYSWKMIDGVNLLIHEGGHFIFRPLGEFMSIAGGTLMQLMLPAAFVVYFFTHAQLYSSALTLFWIGESLINVSIYAADAILMELPLLGGNDVIHDWNYMLTSLGLLDSTSIISTAIRIIGTLIILTAIFFSIRWSFVSTEEEY